jgi:hypothetical protein
VEDGHTSSRRTGEGNLTIIWVPVSPCLHEETALSPLQAALPPGETIIEMPKGKRDAAWKKVCQKVTQT